LYDILEEYSCSITCTLYRNNDKFSSSTFSSVSTRTFGIMGCKICYNFILLWVAR